MSAVPGWYPDPAQPGRLRLWDGNGWTAQTSGPPPAVHAAPAFSGGQTSVLQRPGPPTTPPRRPSRPGLPGWLIGLTAVAVIAIIAGAALLVFGDKTTKAGASVSAQPTSSPNTTAASCQTSVPPGASAAAAAYVHALNEAAPSWTAESAKLAAEDGYPHLSDMAPQAAADAIFLTYLRQIQFPAADVATADRLMGAVTAYRNLLLADEQNFALFDEQTAQRQEITAIRSAASTQLRSLLGLPAAVCSYRRP